MKHIVNIGFDVQGSRKAIELAEKHKGLYATVGIHPHNASQCSARYKTPRELNEIVDKTDAYVLGAPLYYLDAKGLTKD